MKLLYRAVDNGGKVFEDTIEANSVPEATDLLRRRGQFVTEINEAGATAVEPPSKRILPGRNGGLRDLAMWSRQLCMLVQTGTQLAPALRSIEQQLRPSPWRRTLADVRTKVEEGTPLSEAMAQHPDVFDEVTRSLVSAGETAGLLSEMLDRIANITRRQVRIRSSLIAAMVYPVLLTAVGLGVTLVMILAVIPRFAILFTTLDVPVPPTTRMMLATSDFMRMHWWFPILMTIALIAGVKMLFFTAAGRGVLDRLVLRTPVVRGVARSLISARVVRLFGVMLSSHVPMLEAIRLTRQSAKNDLFRQLLADAEDAAVQGRSISRVFMDSDLISPSVAEAMHHGESNGRLGEVLTDVADFLDQENEMLLKAVMSIVEPVILIVLGIAVGSMALSLFLPLFDLAATTGGG